MKIPKEYSLKEIEHLELNLQDIVFPHDLQDHTKTINSFYTLKNTVRKKCSYCNKIQNIRVVEGIKLTNSMLEQVSKNSETFAKKALDGIKVKRKKSGKLKVEYYLYHQKYYLVCDSCLTARSI